MHGRVSLLAESGNDLIFPLLILLHFNMLEQQLVSNIGT